MAKELKFNRLDRVKQKNEFGLYKRGTIRNINEFSKTPYSVIWDDGAQEDCAEKKLRPVDTRRKVIFTIEPTTTKGVKSYRWKSVKNGRVINHKYNNSVTALKQLQQFISDIKSDNYVIAEPGKK